MTRVALTGARVFFGGSLHENIALVLEDGRIADLCPKARLPDELPHQSLRGGILAPGFVDLQVNGGGGVMLGDAPSIETLRTMADAHARLGTTTILPTLMSSRPEGVAATVQAVAAACDKAVPGIAGLHLEGPHLARTMAGAHDPALLRAMTDSDIARLREAAARLPMLKVTLAPELVTEAQIAALVRAGVLVSLGHSACSYAQGVSAAEAGARCVTHLYNAMHPLTAQEPGLLGAALDDGRLSAGLVADLVHVAAACLQIALRAKKGPGKLFLVSNAMAVAGTRARRFEVGGRTVRRVDGRLTFENGALAGADLSLAEAVRTVHRLGIAVEHALSMATTIPARLIGKDVELAPGTPADLVYLNDDLVLKGVWKAGIRL